MTKKDKKTLLTFAVAFAAYRFWKARQKAQLNAAIDDARAANPSLF